MLVLCVSVIHSMEGTVELKPDFYILLFAHPSLHVNTVIHRDFFCMSDMIHNNVRG